MICHFFLYLRVRFVFIRFAAVCIYKLLSARFSTNSNFTVRHMAELVLKMLDEICKPDGSDSPRLCRLLQWLRSSDAPDSEAVHAMFGDVPEKLRSSVLFVDNSSNSATLAWSFDRNTQGLSLNITSLGMQPAFHKIRTKEFYIAVGEVLDGKGFSIERPCVVHIPDVPDGPNRFGFAIPGGDPDRVAISLASVVVARLAVLAKDRRDNAPADDLKDMT